MCFSPEISGSFFIIGAAMTAVAYCVPQLRKTYLYVLLGFYTLMELLQTIQYAYVNECDNPKNKILTEMAYVLVIVQPLVWNILFLVRTTNKAERKVFELAIALMLAWITVNVYSRIVYNPATDKSSNKCGLFNHDRTCTYRDTDSSHLHWRWTSAHLGDLSANYLMYMLVWFVPAMLVKQHRESVGVLIISCLVGYVLTQKYGSSSFLEFPATWCLISIPTLLLAFAQGVYGLRREG